MSEAGEGKTRTGLKIQPQPNPGKNPAGVEVLETFTFGFSWFETGPGETDTLRTHCHKTRTILKTVKKYVHFIVLVNKERETKSYKI